MDWIWLRRKIKLKQLFKLCHVTLSLQKYQFSSFFQQMFIWEMVRYGMKQIWTSGLPTQNKSRNILSCDLEKSANLAVVAKNCLDQTFVITLIKIKNSPFKYYLILKNLQFAAVFAEKNSCLWEPEQNELNLGFFRSRKETNSLGKRAI